MNDELKFPLNEQSVDDDTDSADDYEEITSDEVDRVVEALETLIASTSSLNIQSYLEEAAANIYCLVYDEDDLDGITEAA